MNVDQIAPGHLSRLAYVYIRQSTMHQVYHHRESQRLQRSLCQRAEQLGWSPERIVEIDEDLGDSASRSGQRSGFEKMVAEAALGKVGIVLTREVARLSRGNRIWYHLLDVCAVTGTLLGDADGLYDPRSYNDRLLLGLKGTMSEAELHIMKQRMVEAIRAKAQRGEFRFPLGPGYVWDEAGRMQKDPDDEVRSAIGLIFERFRRLGTAHAAQVSMAEEGLRVPVRSGPGWRIRWRAPDVGYVTRLLHNPIYAGAYVFGRRQMEEVLDESQRPVKRMRKCPREAWHVLKRDHHEGYISWEEYKRNERQIASNCKSRGPGPAREGWSLLQGLVLCGHCGRQMQVCYGSRYRTLRYECTNYRRQTGGPICQGIGATRLEREVKGLLLEALSPLGVEAMVAAAAAHAKVSEAERERWQQRVERSTYEVDLARRQYEAVDPANRLVASELERRWEQALVELGRTKTEAETHLQGLEKPLTDGERQRLREYAQDLQQLWDAPTTRMQDRKRIARCLIENVVVKVPPEGTHIQAAVHWVGGAVSPVEVPKGRRGHNRCIAQPELIALVKDLAEEFTDGQIARILIRKRLKTPRGLSFTARRVTSLRGNRNIPGCGRAPLRGPDVYTAEEAAELLGVARSTIIRWLGVGLLRGSQKTSGAPWRVRVTAEDRQRLKAVDAPKGWLPLKGAACVLGVSQQTVLQRLKSGSLEGVRVQEGRRTSWRIRIPAKGCTRNRNQETLFDQQDPGGDAV